MAYDQLEIIALNGKIHFYDLDPAKGLTNIGRHPENDIVIEDPGVAPFHAMLDHRRKPYQFVLLSPEGQTRLRGERLHPNGGTPLQNLDTIEMGGHTLILMEGQNGRQPAGLSVSAPAPAPPPLPTNEPPLPSPTYASERPPPSPSSPPSGALPARPAAMPPPTTRPESFTAASMSAPPPPAPDLGPAAVVTSAGGAAGSLQSLPADQRSEIIVTELSQKEATLEVEQTALFEVTIINGGSLVAGFAIAVQGVPEEWVLISEPYVNLYEGDRTTVSISITPPRLPSSRAGDHYLAITVTSADYPSQYSRHGATLIVNPYYAFSIGELTPKQQTISWFRRSGQTNLMIVNRGNSDAPFRLEGSDDERACSFEFQVPGEEVGLAAQAEMRLPSEESVAIPIRITPHSRRLFGFRKRTYSFTITTTLLEGGQTSRSMLGRLSHKALLGPWIVLLALFILTLMIIFFFIPGPNPTLYSLQGTREEARLEATNNLLELTYNVSRFKSLNPDNLFNRINGLFLDVTIERKLRGAPDNTYEIAADALSGPRGSITDEPVVDVIYRLTVENWLSLLFPRLARTTTYNVFVVPQLPRIEVTASAQTVEVGQSAALNWSVDYADRLIIKTQDGVALETIDAPEPTGLYEIQPEVNTTYIFEAYNLYTGDNAPETDAVSVGVFVPPTGTPPPPAIAFFAVDSNAVVEGTAVSLSWQVVGTVEAVTLDSDDPADRPIAVGPAGPPVNRQPGRTTLYRLTAANGASTIEAFQEVRVNPAPTATATPRTPQIQIFEASPEEIIKGERTDIELTWSVSGDPALIELTGPDIGVITLAETQGSLTVSADDEALFVLNASTGDLKDSQVAPVRALEPTETPEPPPTPLPDAVIEVFEISKPGPPQVIDLGGDNPHRYQVQVNTEATFLWQVNSAAVQAVLSTEGSPVSEGNPVGNYVTSITEPGTFVLNAENAEAKKVNQSIIVEITEQPPPDPPFNVRGEEEPDESNTLRWDWAFEPGKSDISGYRVYRADIPGGNFEKIADESRLGKDIKEFVDEIEPTCGKGYYVVSVYTNIDGEVKETGASKTSWYSDPC